MNNKSYILNESMVSTIALYMILKRFITPFDQWDAYKLGIIDKEGKKLKEPITAKERESWDLLSKFVWNFKKILNRFIGTSQLVHYLTAAYLLKDSLNYYVLTNIEKLHESYLQDMTFEKQSNIFQFIKKLNLNCKITEENFEMFMFMNLPKVESLLEEIDISKIITYNINEDGAAAAPAAAPGGSSTADMAQFSPKIGDKKLGKVTSRLNSKRRKNFRKWRKENESA